MDNHLSNELLSDIFNQSAIGKVVWCLEKLDDPKTFRLLASNKTTDKALQFPMSDHIGKTMLEIFPDSFEIGYPQQFLNILKGGKEASLPDLVYGDKNVVASIFECRLIPLNKTHLLVCYRDVGEERALQEADAKKTKALEQDLITIKEQQKRIEMFRSSLDHSADCMFIVDPETSRFLYANQTVATILGYLPEEILQLGVIDIREGLDTPEQWKKVAGRVRMPEPFYLEGMYKCKNGERIPMEVSAQEVYSGNKAYFVAILRDLRDRKRYEEKIHQSQSDLAHFMRLNTLSEVATELAHELNQPLTAIVTYAQGCHQRLKVAEQNINDFFAYVHKHYSQKEQERCNFYLDNAKENLDRMLEIIEEIGGQSNRSANIVQRLRDFVRKKTPEAKALDVNKVLKGAIKLLELIANKLNITFNLLLSDKPLYVCMDKLQLEQILVNLLKNALDSMQEYRRGKPEIFIQTLYNSDACVEIIIRDYGKGFSESEGEKLFDNYYTTKENGLGIGLSICRNLVESNGGQLLITGKPNKGACAKLIFQLHTISDSCESCAQSADYEIHN